MDFIYLVSTELKGAQGAYSVQAEVFGDEYLARSFMNYQYIIAVAKFSPFFEVAHLQGSDCYTLKNTQTKEWYRITLSKKEVIK